MPSESSDVRALLHEKLDALLDECDLVGDNAAYGQYLHDVEEFFLVKGRKFLQETFQEKVQERIERTENIAETKQCDQCKKKTHYRNTQAKNIDSVHGSIRIERDRRRCPHCKQSRFPVEVSLGLDASYTKSLTRIVTRCCGMWSYRVAAETLKELSGVSLSYTTVGKIAQDTADKIATQIEHNPAFRETFQRAKGETEFYTDGTFVHILNADGTREWREMKLGAFAKRLLAASALPEEWVKRNLPKPTAVYAFASIADKETFQELCQKMRRHLGVGGVSSALGDGAKWIWNIVREVFGKTDECLDIYHALEHVASCGKGVYGEGDAFTSWYERVCLVLVSEGLAGMERELDSLKDGLKGKSKVNESRRALVESLRTYLRGHSDRLNYCERLLSGRVIGSGLIEGACKNLVGRRLKQTGACWRLERANRMALVASLLYADQWEQWWKSTPKV